jgi:hypothetical protein
MAYKLKVIKPCKLNPATASRERKRTRCSQGQLAGRHQSMDSKQVAYAPL